MLHCRSRRTSPGPRGELALLAAVALVAVSSAASEGAPTAAGGGAR